MSNNIGSPGNVPFSWENKPGIRKDCDSFVKDEEKCTIKLLPPPPCENVSRVSLHDLPIPLPPCAFQAPVARSSSRRGVKKEDDPFLMAYKECTKSTKKGAVLGLRKKSSLLSCRHSCSVRDDSIVRVSQIPLSNSERKRGGVKFDG